MNTDSSKLIFLHLPRTGGTTVHHLLQSHFPANAICPERFNELYQWLPDRLRDFTVFSGHFNVASLEQIPGSKRIATLLRDPHARIISTYLFWSRHSDAWLANGHYPGPLAARRSAGLEAFLASANPGVLDGVDNLMARYLAGNIIAHGGGTYTSYGQLIEPADIVARAKASLLGIEVVGVTEDLPRFYARLAAAWAMPPVAELPRLNGRDEVRAWLEAAREPAVTPTILSQLDRLSWMDREIFVLARQLTGLH